MCPADVPLLRARSACTDFAVVVLQVPLAVAPAQQPVSNSSLPPGISCQGSGSDQVCAPRAVRLDAPECMPLALCQTKHAWCTVHTASFMHLSGSSSMLEACFCHCTSPTANIVEHCLAGVRCVCDLLLHTSTRAGSPLHHPCPSACTCTRPCSCCAASPARAGAHRDSTTSVSVSCS